ncbi:MAG TPA: hypothetical protein PLD20_26895 [Blastocatellia bacterium]|nr:hypothetical protein [Blastocatellia bacterium]HMX27691.1 hypothetical protein [Blastocatellia bacterium]HMZ21591.1 hypothetical protein [Blastocatellia bacterium]HNG31206.1 hypothetical protein [Blastocatellia bacterium]
MPASNSIFLINSDTFKKSFLSGSGQFTLQSDQNLWMTLVATGGKFLPTIGRIADVGFSFANNQKLQFGDKLGMKLGVSAGATNQIHLLWPDQSDADEDQRILKAYGLTEFLTDGKLYVRLLFSAQAAATADAKLPIGTLSASFGIGAGGNVAYERFKLYNDEASAKKILDDLFAGLRLPQQIQSVADIPAPGELLVTRFGGYLNLRAGMNWGFQMAGSQSFEFNQLKLDLDYALRTMASVSFGYKLAGDFSIEARRGVKDGWLRFVVRKNRDSQFNFTADFALDTDHQLNGLPASADEFLTRLIGADAATVLDYFQKARKYASLDALEKALTPLAKQFVHEWSKTLIGKTLSDQTLNEFLSAANKVADAYANLDERLADLYHAYLGRIPQLQTALKLLTAVTNPAELALAFNADEEKDDSTSLSLIELAQILWGTNLFPLLLQNEEFLKFREQAMKARNFINDGATKPLRDFADKLKAFLPLDSLFAQLGKIQNADQLKQLADGRLQDLAGRLIGKTFAELKQTELNDALKTLQAGLNKIEAFKNNWYTKLKQAVNQKFTADLHYAYSRATRNQQLLNVEFDLNTAEGKRLARAAAAGDFAETLENFSAKYIRVNQGVFSHTLSTSAQLRVNVLGWSYDSLKQLATCAEHTIEPTAGGLLHVFATEASIKERVTKGGKFKETIESNFLLRALGETFQSGANSAVDPKTREYLIQTLRSLAVQYDLLESDDQTSAEELTRYLDLAVFLGVLTNQGRAALAADLAKQFPKDLGKVTVQYAVRYDEQILQEAFKTLSDNDLGDLAKQTMRQVIASKYIGMKQTNHLARVGFAYLAPALHEMFDREGFTALQRLKTVTLPGWFTKGAPMQASLTTTDIQLLITLCNLESSYAKRVVALNKTLGKRPIPQKELQDASRKFVQMADDLNDWRENAFFAIFDKIVQEALRRGNDSRAWRQSSLMLEILPPGAKQSVKKILMQQR